MCNQMRKLKNNSKGFSLLVALISLIIVIVSIFIIKIIYNNVNASRVTRVVGNNTPPVSYQTNLGTNTTTVKQPVVSQRILPPPAGSFNIINYGASTASSNNKVAIQGAINAAGKNRGTVFVPVGIFKIAGSLRISSMITLEGSNEAKSILLETVHPDDLLSDRANGTTVENITLNTQEYNGGHAFGTTASYTRLQNAIILSGSSPGHFALYYAGHPGATPHNPSYSTNNKMINIIENDQICDDGISWSFQENSSITNLNETGSRLALYVDKNLLINNYVYHPGVQATSCIHSHNGIPTQGFWITPPSNDITINNFDTYGNGGKLSSGKQLYSTNITINNENFMTNSGYQLDIGDVNGLTISNSNFANNKVVINPDVQAIVDIKNSTLSNLVIPTNSLHKITLTCLSVSPVICP